MTFRFCPYCCRPLVTTEIAGKPRPACAVCGFAQFPDPKVVAGVIVSRDDKILLQQRRHNPGKGRWSFLSGYVDAGEKVEEAARREVMEEAGVEVQIEGLVGVYSQQGNPVIFIVYRGTILNGQPHSGRESLALGFFSPDDLPPLAFEHDKQVLQDWQNIQQKRGG